MTIFRAVSEKDWANFRKSLRAREMTIKKLARLADNSGRPHVTLVLKGIRSGKGTLKKLDPLLLYEEKQMLSIVPRGKIFESPRHDDFESEALRHSGPGGGE